MTIHLTILSIYYSIWQNYFLFYLFIILYDYSPYYSIMFITILSCLLLFYHVYYYSCFSTFYFLQGNSKSGRVVQGVRFRYGSLRRRGFKPHLLHLLIVYSYYTSTYTILYSYNLYFIPYTLYLISYTLYFILYIFSICFIL